ncbi:MAG: hypothetical protein JWL65_6001 [Gammaproteobacteria bacterium]|nr:hypothetical protein [Gammaproteobacteria bacterium]
MAQDSVMPAAYETSALERPTNIPTSRSFAAIECHLLYLCDSGACAGGSEMPIGIATSSPRCGCMSPSLSVARLRSWICSSPNWQEQRRKYVDETPVPASLGASRDARSDGAPFGCAGGIATALVWPIAGAGSPHRVLRIDRRWLFGTSGRGASTCWPAHDVSPKVGGPLMRGQAAGQVARYPCRSISRMSAPRIAAVTPNANARTAEQGAPRCDK